MKYEIYNEHIVKVCQNIITRKYEETLFSIRSRIDFTECTSKALEGFKYAIHYLQSSVILTNLKNQHIEIYPDESIFIMKQSEYYLMSKTETEILQFSPSRKKYEVIDSSDNSLITSIDKPKDSESITVGFNCIEFVLHQCNSYIKSTDLFNNEIRWQKDFNGKILRVEVINNYIVLDYLDQSGATLVLDLISGNTLWQRPEVYSKIDRKYGIILFGSDTICVVSIFDGTNQGTLSNLPKIELGYYPHFIDEEGIYYTNHNGSFGKINKNNSQILWEFDMVDADGEKRKLSDFFLLENGNLVLTAIPNHPNGNLTCVFNPLENLHFSNLKNV